MEERKRRRRRRKKKKNSGDFVVSLVVVAEQNVWTKTKSYESMTCLATRTRVRDV